MRTSPVLDASSLFFFWFRSAEGRNWMIDGSMSRQRRMVKCPGRIFHRVTTATRWKAGISDSRMSCFLYVRSFFFWGVKLQKWKTAWARKRKWREEKRKDIFRKKSKLDLIHKCTSNTHLHISCLAGLCNKWIVNSKWRFSQRPSCNIR